MKLKKIFLTSTFIFLFSLSFVFVSANQVVFESYIETAEMEQKNNVHETIEAIININGSQNFINFSLIPSISNLQVFFDDDSINCEATIKIGGTEILCHFEKPISGKHFLKAEFDSDYPLISLKENKLMFRTNYKQFIETKNFIFILKLPLGYIIPEEPGKDKFFFISPKADSLYSDGQRIILRWEERPLDEKFEVSVISEPLKSKLKFGNAILILALIVFITFLIIYFKKKIKYEKEKIKKKKFSAKKKPKTEIIEEYLMESEKKVIDELKNADKKELWQKQLQLKTEFSKAKLSRIIRNLEARNIIQKIPYGNTNKIKLKFK